MKNWKMWVIVTLVGIHLFSGFDISPKLERVVRTTIEYVNYKNK